MASSSTPAADTATNATTDAVSDKKMVTLRTSDGKVFEVEQTVVSESLTIKSIIDDECAGDEIPLPNVKGSILAKVIEYCKKQVESRDGGNEKDEELKAWEKQFVDVDQDVILELIMAANYLNVKGLLDLTCRTVADTIKGKTPEQIRETFGIENDFTAEEEEEIRRENQWAFE